MSEPLWSVIDSGLRNWAPVQPAASGLTEPGAPGGSAGLGELAKGAKFEFYMYVQNCV